MEEKEQEEEEGARVVLAVDGLAPDNSAVAAAAPRPAGAVAVAAAAAAAAAAEDVALLWAPRR